MVKVATTVFENMLIDKLTDGKTSAEFIEKTAQIFGMSEDYLKMQIEDYLSRFIKSDDVNWFYEVCWICEKEKLVHNDMSTSHENPGFICSKCERLNSENLELIYD